MTEFGISDFIIEQILSVIKHYPQVNQVGIFGSRAKGNYKNYSDIDLAIHANHMPAQTLTKLKFELDELPIIFKMDIVHVEGIDNPDLKEKIKREEKIIYSASSII